MKDCRHILECVVSEKRAIGATQLEKKGGKMWTMLGQLQEDFGKQKIN